jgi:hypothetical protein
MLKKLTPQLLVLRHFQFKCWGGGLRTGPEGWTRDSFQQGLVCDKKVPQEGLNLVKVKGIRIGEVRT